MKYTNKCPECGNEDWVGFYIDYLWVPNKPTWFVSADSVPLISIDPDELREARERAANYGFDYFDKCAWCDLVVS